MTIDVPTPSADLLQQIETQAIETDQNEVAAITAIRERFAPYAKHNGYIRTADYDMQTSNYRVDREAYYERDGKRVKGLLADDCFDYSNDDQNRGPRHGTRLYITESGEWLELRRVGHWTQWEGESQWWYTDSASQSAIFPGFPGNDRYDERPEEGDIRILTDAQVQAEYHLDAILRELAKTMAEMSKKLPARYNRLRANAELAQRVIAGVAN